MHYLWLFVMFVNNSIITLPPCPLAIINRYQWQTQSITLGDLFEYCICFEWKNMIIYLTVVG